MRAETLLSLAVLAPTLGGLALPAFGKVPRVRNSAAFLLVLVALLCSLALIPTAISGQATTVRLHLPAGMDFILRADGLAVFMAIVSSLVSTIIVFYSATYISHYDNQDEYFLMVVLFLGAMMGLVFSGSLLWLYVFWEITAIASWRLIGFFREKYIVVRADKAFMVTGFGALAMLAGLISIYYQTGTFDMAQASAKIAQTGMPLSGMVTCFILFGILSKSATLPFHTWLPDAGVAPSPVTALLHAAVLVKIGVYVYARLFIATFPISVDWQSIVLGVAAASALVSAGAALIDTDLKRIIAFSTVSQIAFIFLGFAVGGEIGVTGALIYILMHGLAKGGLFLCAGIVEQNTHTKDIRKMGGLIKTMPVTAVAFAFCAFSVMGVPPFGGFFGKYMVISGAVEAGRTGWAFVFIVAAFLTILYLFRVFNKVFLGQPGESQAAEGSRGMVASVALLGLLSLVSGALIGPCWRLADVAARQMLGMVK